MLRVEVTRDDLFTAPYRSWLVRQAILVCHTDQRPHNRLVVKSLNHIANTTDDVCRLSMRVPLIAPPDYTAVTARHSRNCIAKQANHHEMHTRPELLRLCCKSGHQRQCVVYQHRRFSATFQSFEQNANPLR